MRCTQKQANCRGRAKGCSGFYDQTLRFCQIADFTQPWAQRRATPPQRTTGLSETTTNRSVSVRDSQSMVCTTQSWVCAFRSRSEAVQARRLSRSFHAVRWLHRGWRQWLCRQASANLRDRVQEAQHRYASPESNSHICESKLSVITGSERCCRFPLAHAMRKLPELERNRVVSTITHRRPRAPLERLTKP
jgi:hypothetical protein